MKRIAKFEKISFKQFLTDWQPEHPDDSEDRIREIYDSIRLPRRATAGSAGYDFFAPTDFSLDPGQCIKILTGIRALRIIQRSSLLYCKRLSKGWLGRWHPTLF